MAQQVRAVVPHSRGKPVSVETITVPDPGPGEAVVAVRACGVCHTAPHYREGGIDDDFPFLLGHEAVDPGDRSLTPSPTDSTRSARGEPWSCFSTHNAGQPMTLASGQPLSPALGIGAFAEKTLVAAGQCTKADPAAESEVAGLLGCGVTAGIGAAVNTGRVRPGASVAVIGCGGVGDAAIAGARPADATHTADSQRRDAVEATKSSWYGDCLPSRDLPRLIDLHPRGRPPLERFVSETIGLDEIEGAFHRMERGEVLRSVVVL
ncbi:alcohol dehydrogenase catalytic domain-containing protein [Streptomyces sp. CWNU-52B]|uniref:alcohol dehydrogenase catalytic domain-containing protein n=1 Tax=unclassified Streptomyces TaxID=2593676 RepID=UPI0039C3AE59